MTEIISFGKVIVDNTFDEVRDILESLEEDYDIVVNVSDLEVKLLLKELYQYYAKKQIAYHFFEIMVGHFEDMAICAVEEDAEVNLYYILNKIQLFELLDSPVEVVPNETRLVVQRVLRKLEKEGSYFE